MARSTARSQRLALAAILAVAALVRLFWALSVEVNPRVTFHWDMTFYDIAANRWADGALMRDFDGTPSAKWSPGYPVLLGSAYALFGRSLLVGKLLNVVLATLTVWLAAQLGTRLFDARTGLLAAGVLAVLPGSVLAPALLSETPFTLLFTGLLVGWLALESRGVRWGAWLGYGAVLGATILVRGSALFFAAIPAAAWWLRGKRLRAVLCRTALVVLGSALVIAPWTLRNWVVLGSPVLISTQQAGMALTFAHSEVATGGMGMGMAGFRDELLAPFRELPWPEREIAENRFETRRALGWMLANPGRELAMLPKRWANLVRHDHTGLTWSTERGAGGTPKHPVVSETGDRVIAGVADGAFWLLMLPALLGLRRCFSLARPERAILPLSIAYFLVLHGLLFAGDPRFHAPLHPVLAVLAAAGIAGLLQMGLSPPPIRSGRL